jgi:hypothetical protein
MKIEARYKYRKLFYRGIICGIIDNRDRPGFNHQKIYYSVQYDDGEIEHYLERDAIRPIQQGEEGISRWLEERDYHLKTARLQYRRKIFYSIQRKARTKTAVLFAVQSYLQRNNHENSENNNHEDHVGDPFSHDHKGASRKRTSSTDSASTEMTAEGKGEGNTGGRGRLRSTSDHHGGGDNDDDSSVVSNNSQTSRSVRFTSVVANRKTTAGPSLTNKASTAPDPSKLVLSLIQSSHNSSSGLLSIPFIKVKIRYTKQVPKFPWQIISQPLPGEEEIDPYVFYNPITNEETIDLTTTLYSAKELHIIRKIQLRWLVFKAMKQLKKQTMSISLSSLIEDTINKGKKIAFIGYKFEGLTVFQLLNRAGYYELSDIISDHYQKVLLRSSANLTIEDIATTTLKEQYEKNLGILQTNHIRDLREFQAWWKKTSLFERENKLSLFNYYQSPYDERSLKQCIEDSLELFIKKFSKYLKTSATKTRKACEMIIESSEFPHSHLQVETYLKRYADKPELARVSELISCFVDLN